MAKRVIIGGCAGMSTGLLLEIIDAEFGRVRLSSSNTAILMQGAKGLVSGITDGLVDSLRNETDLGFAPEQPTHDEPSDSGPEPRAEPEPTA